MHISGIFRNLTTAEQRGTLPPTHGDPSNAAIFSNSLLALFLQLS